MICVECNTLQYGVQRVAEIATKIEEKLVEISEFLRVKALQNIVLGSYPFSSYYIFFSLCINFEYFFECRIFFRFFHCFKKISVF